jgi:hypothetical protein
MRPFGRQFLVCLGLSYSYPVYAAEVIDLGALGSRTGTVSFSEASSYSEDGYQTTKFLFSVASPGTLHVVLGYSQQLRSPLVEVCPDPDSCYVEPSGDYQDYSGVGLRSFLLSGPDGSTFTALPSGFEDMVVGGAGTGIPSYGFDSVVFDFDLGRDFKLASSGSYSANLSGYGLIRGSGFSGSGGGLVNYFFSFQPVISPVPEPSTWAMMILGFGLTGYAIRRRKGAMSQSVRSERLPV